MNRKIDDIDFIIFDVETTGLSPQAGDRIIEIAALRYKNGRTIDTFSSLINPQREISQAAYEVDHISQEMVDSAPLPEDVLLKFMEFAKGSCFAGYNVGFDLGFLENELRLLGRDFPAGIFVIDVMQMARRIMPGFDRYGLAKVSSYIGISTPQEHRALSDVELTLGVFSHLIDKVRGKGVDNFLQFYNLFGFNTALTEGLNNQHIAAIQRAIDLGAKIKIKYYSSSAAEVTERKVMPKEIISQGRAKYLVGYCHLRKDERTFKINAIMDLEIV